jgi:hypothetical protein
VTCLAGSESRNRNNNFRNAFPTRAVVKNVETSACRFFRSLYSLHLVVLYDEVFNGSRGFLSTQHVYLLCYVI